MKRKIFLLIVFFCISLFLIAEDYSDQIVKIHAEHEGKTAFGSGFFWKDSTHVLTAYHVVMNSDKIYIFFNGNTYSNIIVESASADYDLALLRVDDADFVNMNTPLPYRICSSIPTKHVEMVAFPHNSKISHRVEGTTTNDNEVNASLSLRNQKGKSYFLEDIKVFTIGIIVYSGMSGAPVINQLGEIIGVMSGSLNPGGSIGWAIPLRYTQNMNRFEKSPQRMNWPDFTLMNEDAVNKLVSGHTPVPMSYEFQVSGFWNTLGLDKSQDFYLNDSIDLMFSVGCILDWYKYNLQLGLNFGSFFSKYNRTLYTLEGLDPTEKYANVWSISFGSDIGYIFRCLRFEPYLGLGITTPISISEDHELGRISPYLKIAVPVIKDKFDIVCLLKYEWFGEEELIFSYYGNPDTHINYSGIMKVYLGGRYRFFYHNIRRDDEN